MQTTMISILKILHQTKMKKENLIHNLGIKESALIKNINLINILLTELNLNQIENEKGIIKLKLEKKQWSKVFEKINMLTYEEKIDYLYIKLIFYGFINLEKERENLEISRSSINRCFLDVKKILQNNNSEILLENGKGTKLIKLSEHNKKIFILKLMKLILENEILNPLQKNLLNDMKDFHIKMRLTKLVSIYKCLKFPVTPILLSFLCALDIHSKIFKDEVYDINNFSDYEKLKKIKIVIESIGGINFSEKYKEVLLYNVYLISLNKNFYLEYIIDSSHIIIKELFEATKIECESLKRFLLQHLYFGIIKKEFNILKINDVYLDSEDFLLLDLFEEILIKNSKKMYICDKYLIVSLLKKEIVKRQIAKIKNVLILVGEMNTLKQLSLKKDLKLNFPQIKFDIEYNYLNTKINIYKNYDIIINDSQPTLREGDSFYRIKKSLERKIIKNTIK